MNAVAALGKSGDIITFDELELKPRISDRGKREQALDQRWHRNRAGKRAGTGRWHHLWGGRPNGSRAGRRLVPQVRILPLVQRFLLSTIAVDKFVDKL